MPRLKPHEVDRPTLSADTPPEIEAVQLEIFRNMSPGRKFQLVCEANEMARAFALSGLRSRHPEAGDKELFRRLMDLTLGPELAEKAYGPLEASLESDR